MKTITRTKPEAVENQSAPATPKTVDWSKTQWIFSPYTAVDMSNWVEPTGVPCLDVGTVTEINNTTLLRTPNRSTKNAFDSTMNFDGYEQETRYAYFIASEIEAFAPRQVRRMISMEGMTREQAFECVDKLLGTEMAVAEIEGEPVPVPILPVMLNAVRYNLRNAVAENPRSVLVAVGKELEETIAANIKYAISDLKEPQQEVNAGKRMGFDVNAQRNFLALGRPVPDTLKFAAAPQVTEQSDAANANAQLAGAINKLTDLLGNAQAAPEEELPEGFVSEKDTAEFLGEEVIETVSTTPVRCAAKTSRGKQCGNDALKNSVYCQLEAHQRQAK